MPHAGSDEGGVVVSGKNAAENTWSSLRKEAPIVTAHLRRRIVRAFDLLLKQDPYALAGSLIFI